ncbi:helix-turn-helix domain-containing protein [Hymenobacter edaphi]|uniref:HTH cro/C1-type domain-containing protein n=1 Tax=Hymenobacter edaphi TaxID=2211146 RepID=A0A328BT87_9BACT|nr:hypothetical protein DLM85_05360 [Hymenobacter edaphi]
MVDRIRQLLQARQLSPTQFADTIGVARPIISHILGGRNKPSLEVVQKIIAAFPDVAMPWLLTGQGAMLAAESPADTVAKQPERLVAASEPVAQSRRPSKAARAPEQPEAELRAAAPLDAPIAPALPLPQPPPVAAPPLPDAPPVPAMASAVMALAQAAVPAKPPKTIRRVLVFYNDGTFTDFSPSTEDI